MLKRELRPRLLKERGKALRNFPNFLNTYMKYSRDGFVPDIFHYWTGISILAGALERKVWIPFNTKWNLYPNLYVFLVSGPGLGKSSAGRKGVTELLRELPRIKFIPSQVTEARLIELMASSTSFYCGEKKLVQSAGYFYASEASNSLKTVYGDLKPCFTDWYDCNKIWDKGTVKNQEMKIYNVCFNILAGCTFDYLSKLIPEEEVMGGFASRNLFVVHDEKFIRKPKWGMGGEVEAELKAKLIIDLTHIHSLSGSFRASEEFQKAYEEWFPKHDAHVQGLTSEKMQAFLSRKHVSILKVAMILSASERDDLVLTGAHWIQAESLISGLEEKLPKILNLSVMGKRDQLGLNHTLMQLILKSKDKRPQEVRKSILMSGFDPFKIDNTLSAMVSNGSLRITEGKYELLINPNDYL